MIFTTRKREKVGGIITGGGKVFEMESNLRSKFTGWGSFGTKVEQERASDNVLEFVEVAREHLLDGEKLEKVERRKGEQVVGWWRKGGLIDEFVRR